MKSCLVIVGPNSWVLDGYEPSKEYDAIFTSFRDNSQNNSQLNYQSIPFQYDLTDIHTNYENIGILLRPYDQIDVVFAAYISFGMNATDSIADIQRALFANCIQPLALFTSLSDQFITKKISGIFISSIYAHVAPYPPNYQEDSVINPLYYGVSKAGVEQGIKWLNTRNTLHCFNSIALGPIPKPQVIKDSPILHAALCKSMPTGHTVKHHELHNLLNFLFDNMPGSMRGNTIYLDGGYTIW